MQTQSRQILRPMFDLYSKVASLLMDDTNSKYKYKFYFKSRRDVTIYVEFIFTFREPLIRGNGYIWKFSFNFSQGRQLLWLGNKKFPFRIDLCSEGSQKIFERVASLECVGLLITFIDPKSKNELQIDSNYWSVGLLESIMSVHAG